MCNFESGHEDSIKEHLLDHVSLPSNESKKEQRKNDKAEALKSGNLLDLYDDGNPLYDTTDSEYSDSDYIKTELKKIIKKYVQPGPGGLFGHHPANAVKGRRGYFNSFPMN